MNIDKLTSTLNNGFNAVIAFLTSRPFIEYTTVGILAVGFIFKLFLWNATSSTLQSLGFPLNVLILETALSFVVGLVLLAAIAYQKNIYTNEKLFWGSAAAAGTYATAILLVLLFLGIGGKYFGLETDIQHPDSAKTEAVEESTTTAEPEE